MQKGLTAHMIVHNEEQWVWYAIQSVLPYVTDFFIIDTGSTDKTIQIIETIHSKKIKLTRYHAVAADELVTLRNEQIQKTKTDWILLIDGDEVWPKQSIEEFINTIKTTALSVNGIVVKAIVPVGDLFNYQSDAAGRYQILGHVGHFNIRGYRREINYSWRGTYPLEAYTDTSGIAIQKKDDELQLLKNPYWHLSHLVRSSIDDHRKRKIEIGQRKNITVPEVFFYKRPAIVPFPWVNFSATQKLIAYLISPVLTIKRKLIR